MNCLLVAVYHSDVQSLKGYLESIERAWTKKPSSWNVRVLVADNSIDKSAAAVVAQSWGCQVQHMPVDNEGYLRSARSALKNFTPELSEFQWFAVTNSDLELGHEFFLVLDQLNERFKDKAAWVLPDITDRRTSRKINPYLCRRPNKKKLAFLGYVFRHTLLFRLYGELAVISQRLRHMVGKPNMTVEPYAGHGSFLLFHLRSEDICALLDYPPFLYGEEIYIAEELHRSGVGVYLESRLRVYHTGSQTLNSFQAEQIARWKAEANEYLLDRYFGSKCANVLSSGE